MEVSGQLHAPATLPPEKSPWLPLDRRLGGPQSQSGCSGEEKNSQCLLGLKPLIIQPPQTNSEYHAKMLGQDIHLIMHEKLNYSMVKELRIME
jgi:hypothetical protein